MTLKISPQEADKLVGNATFLPRNELDRLQRERLQEMLGYVRERSPYLREKYHSLSSTPNLLDIPVTLRAELMSQFDRWVTDPDVKFSEVQAFVSDFANLNKLFLDRYVIMTTSGTTGNPLSLLRDDRHTAIHGALMRCRYLDGLCLKDVKNRKSFQDTKLCAIISNKGFHSAYLSFLRMREQAKTLGKEDNLILLPIDTPLHELERRLNEFQPEVIACYPSAMLTLIPSQQSGQLHIRPQYIACSAEQLSDVNRQLLSQTFNCPVLNNYCSTEGGEIAMNCPKGHLHVNSDWIIVEPVDEANQPVAPGALSSGVLITNLANFVQPVIRYRLTDKVTWHEEPCGCGLHFPYIELHGREEEILTFEDGGRKVPIASLVMILATIDTEGCNGAQFIQRSPNALEIRFEAKHGFDLAAVGEKLKQYMQTVMVNNGLNVHITLSNEPFIRTQGGKFRVTFREDL